MPLADPTMVVCIDGPLRGQLRAVVSGETYFGVYNQPGPIATSANPTAEVKFQALTYHVHTISFLGFGIRVASMQLEPGKIDTYDVISTLFNEAARQATYRSNGG